MLSRMRATVCSITLATNTKECMLLYNMNKNIYLQSFVTDWACVTYLGAVNYQLLLM